jgi:hypothetical protein
MTKHLPEGKKSIPQGEVDNWEQSAVSKHIQKVYEILRAIERKITAIERKIRIATKHRESKITLERVRAVFSDGQAVRSRKSAIRELANLTKVHPNTAYRALEIGGRFSAYLSITPDGKLAFSEPDPNQHTLITGNHEGPHPTQ